MDGPVPPLTTEDVLHPQPQMRREGWIDLRGAWRFAYDDEGRGIPEGWAQRADVFDRTIQVPFPPESRASGIGETGYHPIVWYRRTVTLSSEARAPRHMLHFGAVDYHAQVWVNGHLAGEHRGGHTPFALEITHLLKAGAEQIIVVRAYDDPLDLRQPRGKQYWGRKPALIFYHRTTGIWQPVWLQALGTASVCELRWTPDVSRYSVDLQLRLEGKVAAAVFARVRLSIDGQALADDTYRLEGAELRRTLTLPSKMRRTNSVVWAPQHPNLIDAVVELVDGDGLVLDRVGSYFGLRRIETEDGQFLLNGVPTFLRLVLAQNYWPDTLLAPPSDAAIRREVELVKELGFNGVRVHQKIEDPRFLYWCDRLGVLVWAEAANAYVFDDIAAERLTLEWLEAVRRDYNHPCIIAWVPLNESWGVPDLEHDPAQRAFVRSLYYLTKTMDPTRPVIGNDGWQHAVGDILSIHDYAMDAALLTERYGSREALRHCLENLRPGHFRLLTDGQSYTDEPVVLSEFGGLSIKPTEGATWFGYATTGDAAALLALYSELVTALLQSSALAGFCYTQLTDTEQETNGLLTAEREPKLDIETVRAVNTQPARSVPSEIMDEIHRRELLRRRAEAAKAQGE